MKAEYIIGAIIVIALLGGGLFLLERPNNTISPQDVVTDAAGGPIVGATSTSATSTKKSDKNSPSPLAIAKKALLYKKSAELTGIDGYVNTGGKPVKISDYIGKKVVLVDIWTYSCINCQRTTPYLNMWYQKYKDQGLEIIGVHTPEFAFEHLLPNVQAAVTKEGIKYPVVLDNEYKTWNAFGNQYWPRKYLIDIDGYIVYDHAGEGSYDETDKAIQKALVERDQRLGIKPTLSGTSGAPSVDPNMDLSKVGSPESYFGSSRNEYLANGTQNSDGDQTLAIPETLKTNQLYLGGTWNFQSEFAKSKSAGAQIKFSYNSKSVFLVGAASAPIHIKVTRDGGKPLGAARGADVATDGTATIRENRLYKLIDDSVYGTHTIEITIQEAGLEAYTFTFG